MTLIYALLLKLWINTDHDLQLLEANISGLGYKITNKCRENQSGEGVACIYKGHLDIQTCTKDNTYTSFECLSSKFMVKSKLHWISIIYRPPIFQQTSYTNIYLHWWIPRPFITSPVSNWQPNNSWWYKYSME